MDRRDFAELMIFQAVADAGSFTRAAARLGRAQSGLSHAVSALEARIGVPLLARSTRNVCLTDAGQRLLEQVSPALDQIARSLTELRDERDQPSGALRLTALEYPARAILVPALAEFTRRYPQVKVEIHVSDKFVDIVGGRFDAGVRFGAHLEKDMVAVSIGGDIQAALVASPDYFLRKGFPTKIADIVTHERIDYRTASHGDVFRWRLHEGGRTFEIPALGTVTVNDASVMIEAAIAGMGLAYTFTPHVAHHLVAARLQSCLEEFCPVWSGYHLYYPSRTQKSAALQAFIEVLRTSGKVRHGHGDFKHGSLNQTEAGNAESGIKVNNNEGRRM